MATFNFWDSAKGNIPVVLPMSLVAGVTQSVGGNCQVFATGQSPGATGADNVIATFTVPGNAFVSAGNGIFISAYGTFANNGNNKRVKIIVNPASATIGSTVGAGGTTIADTGTYSTSALSTFVIDGFVFKYGATGSNTQIGINYSNTVAASPATLLAPATLTANESGNILIAVTGNAGSAVADILLNVMLVQPIS